MRRRACILATAAQLAVILIGGSAIRAAADCPGGFGPTLPLDPNVGWVTLPDSITGCPAGDSVLAGRQSRIRGIVFYGDECNEPRAGVPPDSIWVTVTILSGNLKVNDKSTKIFADDSTDAQGRARITIPSLSGCGRLRLNLFVSGVAQDPRNVTARTTDTNADARTTDADALGVCDLNYNGEAGDLTDLLLVANHRPDWHRNALHGTPVRRTDLTRQISEWGAFGSGGTSWKPDGDSLAFSSFRGPNGECVIVFVPSDPKEGNALAQRTFPPPDDHDYDPSWSPRTFEFTFDREDSVIYRKGIPGIARDTDTSEVTVALTPDPDNKRITEGAISPNGRAVVFTQIDVSALPQFANLYTVPITGGTPAQITSGTGVSDRMPQWSPDGRWIYFGRLDSGSGLFSLYKVRDTGDSLTLVWEDAGRNAKLPGLSADGAVLAAHIDSAQGRPAFVHTVEPDPPVMFSPRAIVNYLAFPNTLTLVPRISPDGTRLGFVAPPPGGEGDSLQVWAARRNMNNPPTLAAIGDQVVTEGDSLFFYVSATNPENDLLAYAAYFLRTDLGMSFDPVTRLFSWRPGAGTAGNSYWVKFQVATASGGTDWEVIKISVIQSGAPNPGAATLAVQEAGLQNPSRGPFALVTPIAPALKARLSVFNLAGRLVARVEAPATGRFAWDTLGADGVPASPGVYFYRFEMGQIRRTGKWVLLR